MKFLNYSFFCVGLLVALFSGPSVFAQDCAQTNLIRAESTKFSASIFEALKKQIAVDPRMRGDRSLVDFLKSPPRDNISLMYLADINNDAVSEYIFVSPGSGSGSFVNVYVFSRSGNRFTYMGLPPKPAQTGDGPWFFNWHRDPKTKQIQVLVSGCGKVYMQFDSTPKNLMSRYLWMGRSNQKVSGPK